jgi:hypothetical protein
MNSKVTEIAPNVYRISTFHSAYGIQFNQFLINDDVPRRFGKDMASKIRGKFIGHPQFWW